MPGKPKMDEKTPSPAVYWLRPMPGAPLSGPYTEQEACERMVAGRVMWPEQQLLTGPTKAAARNA